jgi:hypothetical protein
VGRQPIGTAVRRRRLWVGGGRYWQAYALGEGRAGPPGSAGCRSTAKAFYGTIAVTTLIGMFINFVGIDPIKALFWAAVLNGAVAQCRWGQAPHSSSTPIRISC